MPHGLSAPPFGAPGLTAVEAQLTRDFITDNHWILERGVVIPSDAVDSLNTPTTKLRAGLVLARAEAGTAIGKFVPYGHTDAPVANDIKRGAILSYFVNMFDSEGNPEEKFVAGVKAGFVDDSKLFWDGAIASWQTAMKAVLNNISFEE